MTEANTDRVRTTANLPFQLHEEVGLNVRRLETICQIAGFRHLRIQNDPHGETTETVPQVVGINPDGSASAGKVRVNKIPTYRVMYSLNNRAALFYKQVVWKDMTIFLNTEEIKQRILFADESVRNPVMWGNEINNALKSATFRSGAHHLIRELGVFDRAASITNYSVMFYTALRGASEHNLDPLNTAYMIAYALVLVGTSFTLATSLIYGFEREGEGRRISFFFGPELDRAVALALVTKTGRLAKAIPAGDKPKEIGQIG